MTSSHLSSQAAALLAFVATVTLALVAALVGSAPDWVVQSADSGHAFTRGTCTLSGQHSAVQTAA